MGNKIICHDIYGHRKEIDAKKLAFRPSVYGVLIEKNKILLSKQWDGYDFPGGGVNIGETVQEALEREFWEETGLKIKVNSNKIIACETSFFLTPFSKKYVNSILIYFVCERIGGKLSLDYLDKHEQKYIGFPEWISIDNLGKIKFYNSVNSIKMIKKAVKMNNLKWI